MPFSLLVRLKTLCIRPAASRLSREPLRTTPINGRRKRPSRMKAANEINTDAMVISLRKASGKWINPNGRAVRTAATKMLCRRSSRVGPGGFLPEIDQNEVDQQQPELVPEEPAGVD
jgi:hypothetical protein